MPSIDLNTVLQSNTGGGGGQSPFKDANDKGALDNLPTMEERAKKIQDLITQLVEPSQWQDNGGEGASMHYFNGTAHRERTGLHPQGDEQRILCTGPHGHQAGRGQGHHAPLGHAEH